MVAVGQKNLAHSPARDFHPGLLGGLNGIDGEVAFRTTKQIPVEIVSMRLGEPGPGEDPFENLSHAFFFAGSFVDHARFSVSGLMGSFLIRIPVAAKIPLQTAGAMGGVPGSPIPPRASPLGTMWTSITGVSFILSIR